jgi:hypothetical protein
MSANHHHDHPDREHTWRTRSAHTTSEGLVSYQACSCGRWRILAAGRGGEIARSPY